MVNVVRDQLKIVFSLTAVTESGTASGQSVSAIAETHYSLTAITEIGSECTPNCYPLLIRPPDTQHILDKNIL